MKTEPLADGLDGIRELIPELNKLTEGVEGMPDHLVMRVRATRVVDLIGRYHAALKQAEERN